MARSVHSTASKSSILPEHGRPLGWGMTVRRVMKLSSSSHPGGVARIASFAPARATVRRDASPIEP